jgi:hypothetical protein
MTEGPAPTPPLDHRHPALHAPPRPRSWRTVLVWAFVGFGAFVLLVAILLPSLGRAREGANRVKCASNLRQIGQAALMYANDHGGQLPPDLQALYLHGDLTSEVFICPSDDKGHPTGATAQQVVASMLDGNHLSFVWAGAGVTTTTADPANVVIAFDLERHVPKETAPGKGINALLADGSATFVNEATARAIWAQFAAGVRPIRLPAASSGAASQPTTRSL